jgi:hypothetical protein
VHIAAALFFSSYANILKGANWIFIIDNNGFYMLDYYKSKRLPKGNKEYDWTEAGNHRLAVFIKASQDAQKIWKCSFCLEKTQICSDLLQS